MCSRIIVIVFCFFLYSCDESSEIVDIDLVGIYEPNLETVKLLGAMGFEGKPKFVVDRHLNLSIKNMPVVWNDWSWGGSIKYDNASGTIELVERRQLLMHLSTKNGASLNTTFTGSELYANRGTISIRIPYRGWDQDAYLVFNKLSITRP